jgi:hypothetical protein
LLLAEFRPLLIGGFAFTALQAVILNEALSLMVVLAYGEWPCESGHRK